MHDLICISHLRWDFVWQRPQQLLSRLAKHRRVLFVEEPLASSEVTVPQLEILPGRSPHTRNITVVRLLQPMQEQQWIGHGNPLTQRTYAQLLVKYLKSESYNAPILWLYTPMAAEFADVIPYRLLIMDVMDQLSAFKGAPTELVQYEKKLLPKANIVFTGGVSLYNTKLAFNSNTYLFPSGVDINHFAPAASKSNFERPPELASLSGPIIGYFGVIDERMDMSLIKHIASSRPNWNVVLVGPVVKVDPNDLPQAPNLHYVGMKNYDELPQYLAYFDVAMIPFALNESTRFVSPTKTLEYMAARKPIVTTPIHDVLELYSDVVRTGYTQRGFVAQISEALSEDAKVRYNRENALLAQYTWDNIVQRMNQIISERINIITLPDSPYVPVKRVSAQSSSD